MNTWCKALVISSLIVAPPLVTTPSYAEPHSLTQLFPVLVGIQLKPEQQSQLEQISQQTLPKVKARLSAQQLKQFNAALAQNQSVRVALSALDLSIAQQFGLRNDLQSVRSQIIQALTPDQQRQVMQNFYALQQAR